MIFNVKDEVPDYIVEKRLIHTVESLIVDIMETRKIPRDEFYLYEPHKKMLLKVNFQKSSSKKIKVGEKTCETDTYILKISGRNKSLIRVYVNPYPVKVKANSMDVPYQSLIKMILQKELSID